MFQREKERKDVTERRKAILEAIKKFEYENPLKHWGPSDIKGKLKISISYRRVLSHLKELEKRGFIIRVARGRYYSKHALFWKKIIQEFLIYDVYETVPRLEGEKFNEFLSRRFPVTNKLEREYRKKSRIPIACLFYGRKLQNILATKRSIKPTILNWLRNDLDFIENATEITVLSSKKLPLLNTYKIRETFAEVLYNVLAHERELAETKEEKFSLENFGLNIIVSFNPRKVGKPPRRPTMTELIAETEKLLLPEDRQFLGLDEERLKRLKLLDKKRKERLATRESEQYSN